MIKNIIILISVTINVLFYFGLLEIGAYKNLVDSTIQTGKNIVTEAELNKLVDVIKKETANGVGGELSKETQNIINKIQGNKK